MSLDNGFLPIRRALVSTSDKANLIPLCKVLFEACVEIIATGNTANYIRAHGIEVTPIEAITSCKEILGGRVKTLHPSIFGGILARRNNTSDMETLEIEEIDPIDLVVVNLYPFEKTAASAEATHADCIETIDIGGPSLLRAAAKNYDFVTVLSDPNQYEQFLKSFSINHATSLDERKTWAKEAFSKTAFYDLSIASFMGGNALRYGENPHQNAKVLVGNNDELPLANTKPIHGKELSYNNLLDAHAAVLSLRWLMNSAKKGEFGFGCTVIKHGTISGACLTPNLADACQRAFKSDPVSAFGGIIALSSCVDHNCANILSEHFIEVIIAPDFSKDALNILTAKKDLRLLKLPTMLTAAWPKESFKSIFGGLLSQDLDKPDSSGIKPQIVTEKSPCDEEIRDAEIAMALAAPCLSNAITIVKNGHLLGVGAGQTSRVQSVKLAIEKAQEHGHNLKGAALASDGFFPFEDSLLLAHEVGISTVIQPGGSKKDIDVTNRANELGLAMIFTGVRHFRH